MAEHTLSSPNGTITVQVGLNTEGQPFYSVAFRSQSIIKPSLLGFEFKDSPGIKENLEVIDSKTRSFHENWELPWGEQRKIHSAYNELVLHLKEQSQAKRKMDLIFRLFDDGIGFRYRFPEQATTDKLLVLEEVTEFNLAGDHSCCWQPGDWDSYEHLYHQTAFSEIDAISLRNHPNLKSSYIPENAVNTPVTMETRQGVFLSFHEAAIYNYPGITLRIHRDELKMTTALVGSDILKARAKVQIPFQTPWRTIQIAESAGDLIESPLLLNLNEPNILGNIPYFQPMKYIGIWWEMHIGKSTWDIAGSQDMSTFIDGKKKATGHGATTENALRYIDFAADNGIKGLLVEGWNTGWEQWIHSTDREGVFDFMTPYPDYDFDKVVAYARKRGVEMIMHHETSAAPRTYETQMHEAFDFLKKHGMNSVKTGYVGKIIPTGEYHHGQWMVNHYQYVLEEAAKKQIAINAHEPIMDTGKRRTYPNAISREGLRGQEFNAWATDGGNPPDHIAKIAFTRMLAGPIDFTPGVFNIKFNEYKKGNQVNTTLCHQLALYVVIYSPVQMVCDLPEHYLEGEKIHPAFQFIKDVGVDWEQTKVLDGKIGDYVVIARQERISGNWFVGGISDENERTLTVDFSFLNKGEMYLLRSYQDGENAHWDLNPESYMIIDLEVTNTSQIDIPAAAGGGFAMSIMPKS